MSKMDRKRLRAHRKAAGAPQAEIWEDRDGKARPTPQRRLKGVFRLRDGDDAGVSVAFDEASGVIDALAHAGRITARQREAGHIFEEVSRGAVGSPAGRSCVDFTPVGHDGDEDDEDAVRAQARWRSLRRMLHPAHRQECMAVCWEGKQPRSVARLRDALDCVGDWAGLEKQR